MFESHLKQPISFPTLTGSIVTFNSQYAGLPLKSHTVDIDSVSGVSAINISATGKNIGNKDLFVQGTIKGDGTDGASSWRLRSPFIPVKPDNSYSFMCNSEVNIYEIHKYGANGEYYGYNSINATSTIYTFPSNVYYTKVLIRYSNNAVIDITDLTQFQIAESETALPYEPFGTYTTIQIGSTINEGKYNARTGVLEVTQPSVQTLQLPPCPIDTLEGVNNIWADTGDTTLQYIKLG